MMRTSIKQNMSKDLVSVVWDSPIARAAELMEEQRIRHLPVVDDMGIVVGILSERDVNRAMNPSKPGFTPGATVSEFMSWPVITLDQNLPLKDAAQGMIDEKISSFLVTDGSKAIIGIVTSEDLLRALVALLSTPNSLTKLSLSPVVGELLREAQAVGI